MKSKEAVGNRSGAGEKKKTVSGAKKPGHIVKRGVRTDLEGKSNTKEKTNMTIDENGLVSTPIEVNWSDIGSRVGDQDEFLIADFPVTNLEPDSSGWLFIPGFDLEGASRNRQYFIRCMLILADCSVQRSPEEIFDVLGRNFNNTGGLMWWLRKIGKAHIARQVKGKDVVDAVRKSAHELHRELKREIGRPVARW